MRATAASWAAVTERGYTTNQRWLVGLEGGGSAFVKAAVDDDTAESLRTEHRMYATLAADFMPRLLAWDGADPPVLVLEDLAGAHWPPPWSRDAVEAVLVTLEEVARTTAPWLAPVEEHELPGWHDVAKDAEPFLGLGHCSRAWLEDALPVLLDATDRAPLAGAALLHSDVRSDNICLRHGRALLVDWNHACRGNPLFDLAFWLPSLALEGGPQPNAFPEADAFAGYVAGYFASRAGLLPPPGAPRVRPLQLAQLRVALPWAVHVLGLPDTQAQS